MVPDSKPHSVLTDVRDALAAPKGDAGVEARLLALDSVQNLVEQFETQQRQLLAADRALDWIAQNHRKAILDMPTQVFAELREAGRISNPAKSPEA